MGIFDFLNKNNPADVLLEERRRIVTELKGAEINFLKHKIDRPTFDAISKERNSDLIRIEAEIDSHKHKGLNSAELKIANSVSSDKRKVISGLLDEKQKKVYELKLAESGYLKRRISEEVFQKISSEVKKEIISIDSQIKSICESEEISRLKASLKVGASEISKQQKLSDERKKQDYWDQMEDEIFEQALDLSDEQDSKRDASENTPANNSVASTISNNAQVYDDSESMPDEKNIPRRLRRRR